MTERPPMYDWSDACDYMSELEAEIDRLRAALELIAGNSTDKLQQLQAKQALANIGPRS